jgi:DNA-binding FadR family transcriptional regulator
MATGCQELVELIRGLCTSKGLAPGGRLPTERQLACDFGVTRTMVRHALAALEAEGWVSREVGRGTFVRRRSSWRQAVGLASPEPPKEFSPADVMAVRRLLEPRVLPLVVAWATQRDFDEMRRCLEGGARADTAAEFEVWDLALHHAIMAASRNQLLVVTYEVVERARGGSIWGSLKRRNDSRERRRAYQADHEELVAALCARETEHAVQVMEAHLARVQQNLLGTDADPARACA